MIETTAEDSHEPSIAVNAFEHVVIDYTCSGPSRAPSACVAERIPVGQFYTGNMRYLTFTNDHDDAPQDAESFFANVRVFEN